ncbi:MAG: PTS sugar transporter subunit IIA [Actinomycetota bacterium]|nr:PTS sugar transporter subunit IIA [Actinomycetota bacterium]
MIEEILLPDSIQVGKSFSTKEEATIAAGKILLDNGYIEKEYIDSMLEKLDKESFSTFVGNGVAIPHGMLSGVKYIKKTGISFIQIPEGVDWNGETAYIVVGIAGIGEEQVEILGALANQIEDEEDAKRLQEMDDVNEIYKTLTKIAVHFGAGNVGRGFIAPLLQENGYHVIFVDSSIDLVEKINNQKEYKVTSYDRESTRDNLVEKTRALHTEQDKQLKEILNRASLVTSSVGPNNLGLIANLLDKHIEEKVDFIAFENMYRASTYVLEQKDSLSRKIQEHDVVVDKIIPLQNIENLNLIVESFGSIVFDQEQYTDKLIELSEVVRKGDYEKEFTKKLWLLNGLHVCLAYYGLSKGVEYIYELYEQKDHEEFIEKINSEYLKAYTLYSNQNVEEVLEYQNEINLRFSSKKSKDQTKRIARNPEIKFSKSERVHGPLKYLIKNGEEVSAMKEVLEIIFNNEFNEVDGFIDFKKENLSNGKEDFYLNYWKEDKVLAQFLSSLGK